MERTTESDRICSDCWARAIYAYGTGQIFLKRSRLYTKLLQGLSFSGIVFPLLIGGVALGFGTDASHIKLFIAVAAVGGIIQLLFSAWSIVYSWADNLQYSLESASENFDISLKFRELGERAEAPPPDLEVRVAALKAKDDARQMADAKKNITPKNLRYGHRGGLRQFGKECTECKQIPPSMNSTNCNTCGRF